MPPPPPPDALKPPQQTSLSTTTKTQETDVLAEKKPKYSPGVLIWAKMTGHPYWPCMVTDDPIQEVYTRVSGKSQSITHCLYIHMYIISQVAVVK